MKSKTLCKLSCLICLCFLTVSCTNNRKVARLEKELELVKQQQLELTRRQDGIEGLYSEIGSSIALVTKELETNRTALIKIGTEFQALQRQGIELDQILSEIDSLGNMYISLSRESKEQKDLLDFNSDRVTTMYDEVLDNSIRVVSLQKEIKTLFEKSQSTKTPIQIPQTIEPLLDETKKVPIAVPIVTPTTPVSVTSIATQADSISKNESSPAIPVSDVPSVYSQAKSLLDNWKYEASVKLFNQIIEHHPDHELAVNARYWKAEAYYSANDYITAMVYFQDVINQHSDSEKAADSYTKIGMCYMKLNDYPKARSVLNQIRSLYPGYIRQTVVDNLLQRLR